MHLARAFFVLLCLVTITGCDGNHDRVYPTDDVSGRWIGTGAYRDGGTYDAELLFRQDGQDVTVNGLIRYTDAAGGTVEVPYDLRAVYQGATLTFETGFGVATLSDDGRSLRWLFGDGAEAFDLVRK